MVLFIIQCNKAQALKAKLVVLYFVTSERIKGEWSGLVGRQVESRILQSSKVFDDRFG